MLVLLEGTLVRIMTNNPRKIEGLKTLGIRDMEGIALVNPPNLYNAFYLEIKDTKSRRFLDASGMYFYYISDRSFT